MKVFLLSELVLTAMLTGLIWTIQLINYPQLQMVGAQDYSAFHQFHIRAITPLVAPLMIAELILCSLNLYQKNLPIQLGIASLILVLIVWATTFFLSVPLHEKMVLAKNLESIHKLVSTNWMRTIAWSVKLFLMMVFFLKTSRA